MVIHILQWNGRSIRNKILNLQSYLSTFASLPDILCLQETYLNKQTFFSLTDYQVIRKDRSNGNKGGGICFCVKNAISFSEIRLPECSNSIEIMEIKVSNVAIFNVYNPPANSIDKTCLSFITKFPKVIFCGDLSPTTRCGTLVPQIKMVSAC